MYLFCVIILSSYCRLRHINYVIKYAKLMTKLYG